MKKIAYLILILFICFMSYTVSISILNYETVIYSNINPYIVILGCIIYIFLLYFLYKKIIPKICDNKIIQIVLIVLFFVICIISGLFLKVNPSWDMGEVYDVANQITENKYTNHYLYRWNINVGITIVYILLFKIAKIFTNTPDYLTIITIFNSIVTSLSVICMYFISKKVFDSKKAMIFLIISIFTTPIYMYCAIYYNDSMAMLITALIICMLFISNKYRKCNKSKKEQIFVNILMGILIFIGIKIKMTSIFVVFAYLLYMIINKEIKQIIKPFIIVLITILFFNVGYKIIINNTLLKDKELREMNTPVYHSIMMGLKGQGGYNQEDLDFSFSQKTYLQRKKADIDEINKRLKNYNGLTFQKHINSKIIYTWGDGTYFGPEKIIRNPVNRNILHDVYLVDGKYSRYYKYIPQVMHFSMLILIIIEAAYIMKNKEYNKKSFIGIITMFGFFVFLLIWETRSRYLLASLPIFIITSIEGLERLVSTKKNKSEK